jgi:hypothetical protein
VSLGDKGGRVGLAFSVQELLSQNRIVNGLDAGRTQVHCSVHPLPKLCPAAVVDPFLLAQQSSWLPNRSSKLRKKQRKTCTY